MVKGTLSDLLTAPPHIPAKPLHLLQLHDGSKKEKGVIHGPLVTASHRSDLPSPFHFCTAPNSARQGLTKSRQHSYTSAVHWLEKQNSISFQPPPPHQLPLHNPGCETVFCTSLPFASSKSVQSFQRRGLTVRSFPFYFNHFFFSPPPVRLHSASYPFLKSVLQSWSCLPSSRFPSTLWSWLSVSG